MDIKDNLDALIWRNPHRYPFILIDKVSKVIPNKEAIVQKMVSLNEPIFGEESFIRSSKLLRFPSHLVIESFCQAAGVVVKNSTDLKVYLVSMKGIHIMKNVFPGEQICHYVKVERAGERFLIVSGKSEVNDQCVIRYENILISIR